MLKETLQRSPSAFVQKLTNELNLPLEKAQKFEQSIIQMTGIAPKAESFLMTPTGIGYTDGETTVRTTSFTSADVAQMDICIMDKENRQLFHIDYHIERILQNDGDPYGGQLCLYYNYRKSSPINPLKNMGERTLKTGARFLSQITPRGEQSLISFKAASTGSEYKIDTAGMGEYVWALRGACFYDDEERKQQQNEFMKFCIKRQIPLTPEQLQEMKHPYHFALFDNGERILMTTDTPLQLKENQLRFQNIEGTKDGVRPLLPDEIKSGKTTRCLVTRGKQFSLMEKTNGFQYKAKIIVVPKDGKLPADELEVRQKMESLKNPSKFPHQKEREQ